METANWPRYQCHKIVQAMKIIGSKLDDPKILPRGAVLALEDGTEFRVNGRFVLKHDEPRPGDYLVRYEDGYLSISPAKAFEEGYTRL